jgi:hypothetical protein
VALGQRLLLRGLNGQPRQLLLIHAFWYEGELVHLFFHLGLLREVHQVAEVVLSVVPLLLFLLLPLLFLFLLLLHRRERSSLVVLIIAEEPLLVPRDEGAPRQCPP